MKTITKLLIFLILLVIPQVNAVEEVVLDIDGESEGIFADGVISDDEWYFDMGGKTLQEKLKEIKAKEAPDIAKSFYLI